MENIVTDYMTNFTGDDMPGQVSYAKGTPESAKPQGKRKGKDKAQQPQQQEQQEQQPQQQEQQEQQASSSESEQQSEDEDPKVPDGTTAEILAWVGEDKRRAQAAL